MSLAKGSCTADRTPIGLHASPLADARLCLASLRTPVEQLSALICARTLDQQPDRWPTITFQPKPVRFRDEAVMTESQCLRMDYLEMSIHIVPTSMDDTFRDNDPKLVP